MMGGTVMGFFAGLHYWFPKMTGKMLDEKIARIAWALIFLGFNVTFFTMFITGFEGMPRRYAEYLPRYHVENVISSVGSAILAVGIAVMFWNFLRGLLKGPPAPGNPWRALTLEWQTPSPPPTENFPEIPVITDWPYGYGKPEGPAA
jgi:cytochrome c oxidase subunit 1